MEAIVWAWQCRSPKVSDNNKLKHDPIFQTNSQQNKGLQIGRLTYCQALGKVYFGTNCAIACHQTLHFARVGTVWPAITGVANPLPYFFFLGAGKGKGLELGCKLLMDFCLGCGSDPSHDLL